MFSIMIDKFDGKTWQTLEFRKGYETLEEAAKAYNYLCHHNSDLIGKLSIRLGKV